MTDVPAFENIEFREKWGGFENPETGFFVRNGVIPHRLFYSEYAGDITKADTLAAFPCLEKSVCRGRDFGMRLSYGSSITAK